MNLHLAWKRLLGVLALVAVALAGKLPDASAAETLPAVGYVSTYAGAQLDGRQCVPAARDVILNLTGKKLPYVSVAADLWTADAPGFVKVARGSSAPPKYSAVIWDSSVSGAGHVAVALGSPSSGVVRVVDSNWCANNCELGRIRDVQFSDSRVLGWLVPQSPPPVPTLLAPQNWQIVYGSPVYLDWSTSAGATGYDVLAFTWTGSAWTYYGGLSTANSQVYVSGLPRGRYYAWVVIARNASGSTASAPGYFALL